MAEHFVELITLQATEPRPQGYKTQLSMDFFPLINVKMPTTVGIFTFISRKNNILNLSEFEKKTEFLDIFYLFISCSVELCMKIFL